MIEDYKREMAALATNHEPFKVKLPPAESGDWKLETFEVPEEPNIALLRWYMEGRGVPAGTYNRLKNGQHNCFMSDTPAELGDCLELFNMVYGCLLITGLGLGMVPRALIKHNMVGEIHIVEKEPDVIKLTGGQFDNEPRITIHEGDAFNWLPPEGIGFDFAWHDIWPDMSEDYAPEMALLREHYRPHVVGDQLCWGEESFSDYQEGIQA